MAYPRPRRRVVARALVLSSLLAIFAASPSSAQVYGIWGDPAPVEQGTWEASGNLLLGDFVGIMAGARTGINATTDVGVQLGIPDFDGTDFGLAVDVRKVIIPASDTFPMDFAVDGAFGFLKGEAVDVLDFDFGAVVSTRIETAGGTELVPYGGLTIAIARFDLPEVKIPNGPTVGGSATETDVHVRFGMAVPMPQGFDVLAELNVSSRKEFFYLTLGGVFPL